MDSHISTLVGGWLLPLEICSCEDPALRLLHFEASDRTKVEDGDLWRYFAVERQIADGSWVKDGPVEEWFQGGLWTHRLTQFELGEMIGDPKAW